MSHQKRSLLTRSVLLAEISRPDLNFDICNHSFKVKNMNACDVIELRKLVTCIKNDKNQIAFPHLNLNSIKLITYADGSFNILPNGRSQGGHIIFPTDNGKNCCPLI